MERAAPTGGGDGPHEGVPRGTSDPEQVGWGRGGRTGPGSGLRGFLAVACSTWNGGLHPGMGRRSCFGCGPQRPDERLSGRGVFHVERQDRAPSCAAPPGCGGTRFERFLAVACSTWNVSGLGEAVPCVEALPFFRLRMACGVHGALRGPSGRGVFHVERWARDRQGQRVFRVVFRMRGGAAFRPGGSRVNAEGWGPNVRLRRDGPGTLSGFSPWVFHVERVRGTRGGRRFRGVGRGGPGSGSSWFWGPGGGAREGSVPPGFLGPAHDPHPSPLPGGEGASRGANQGSSTPSPQSSPGGGEGSWARSWGGSARGMYPPPGEGGCQAGKLEV